MQFNPKYLSLYLISWFCYVLNQTLNLWVTCEIFNLVMNKFSTIKIIFYTWWFLKQNILIRIVPCGFDIRTLKSTILQLIRYTCREISTVDNPYYITLRNTIIEKVVIEYKLEKGKKNSKNKRKYKCYTQWGQWSI